MRIFTLFILAAFSNQVFSQDLSLIQVKEDIFFLKQQIIKYNTSVYDYTPQFDSLTNEVINTLDDKEYSYFEAFQAYSKTCAASNEGHFVLGNWTDTLHSGFLGNTFKYLPISIKIIENKVFIWNDFSNERLLKTGDEILEINGEPIERVLLEIATMFPTDGDNKTYFIRKIERGFAWMYHLFYDQPALYGLKVKKINGEVDTAKIEALTRDKQFENYESYFGEIGKKKKQAFYTFNIGDTFAYLKIPSFNKLKVKESKVKAKMLYRKIFKELKRNEVEHLVIDLRGNEGGLNVFADKMVPYFVKQNQEQPYLRKSVSWLGKVKIYKMPSPSRRVFTGQIYVLVDGFTFSNGTVLTRYLKEYANATVIGEETGGRYEGFAAGSRQSITLPNSGFQIGVPRYQFYFPENNIKTTKNRGVLPDIEVIYTIEDLISGKDLYLNIVRQLIQNASNET